MSGELAFELFSFSAVSNALNAFLDFVLLNVYYVLQESL